MPQQLPPNTRIVFDTNILISTFVFPGFSVKVYNHCALRHDLFTSEWILDELNTKLKEKFSHLISNQQRDQILSTIHERHTVVSPTNALPTDSPDPDDNYVLQTALFVGAHFLITGDKEHLLPLKRVHETEIISPREFYERYIG